MSAPQARLIGARVAEARSRIDAAAARCGRSGEAVRLMAVTKTFPAETVAAALEAGIRLFGENRVQEAQAKYGSLPGGLPAGAELHLIGHLQRNKAAAAARLFHGVQSIDKPETARELARRLAQAGRSVKVLVEVNTSGEPGKFGLHGWEELARLTDTILELEGLTLRGLMTVGPFTEDRDRIRRAFAELRELFATLRERYPEPPLDTLSMGMSADYELAVAEGSTLVRLGTALFGGRT